MAKIKYILFLLAVLLAATQAQKDLTLVTKFVNEKIESDFNDIWTDIDENLLPVLYNLIEQTQIEENSTLLYEVKKCSSDIKEYVASLRSLYSPMPESNSDCLFRTELGALKYFNKVLKAASNCVMVVQTSLLDELAKDATSLREAAKSTAEKLKSPLNVYNRHYGGCLDIACVDSQFDKVYERYEDLFYKKLLLILKINNLTHLNATKDCTTKYSKDLRSFHDFAKMKLGDCVDGITARLAPTDDPNDYYG